MKGIILLNGEQFNSKIDYEKGDIVYCCDGAYSYAKNLLPITKIIGDFDSLGYVPQQAEVYPSEKNYTDGELALKLMLKKKVTEILIYGGGGLREDHFIGNLGLLYLAFKRKVLCKMITNYSQMYFASGKTYFKNLKGKTISIEPFYKSANIIESKGLKYPLINLQLKQGESRGISNIVISDDAYFICDKGNVLVFINNKI